MHEQITDDNLLDAATEWFVRMRADKISPQMSADFVRWMGESVRHQAAFAEIGGFWDGLPAHEREARELSEQTPVTSLAEHRMAKALKQGANQSSGQNSVESSSQSSVESSVESSGQNSIKNPVERSGSRRFWSRNRVAAALVFVILGITGWRYGNIFLMETHSTKIGEQADIILDDGSHLELNTNSKIRVDLQQHRRIVYLQRGEVFFNVARDETRPFFVITTGGLVRVLGTKFNIRQIGTTSDVTVLAGSVAVKDYGHLASITDNRMVPDATLAPGQEFVLGDDGMKNVAFPADSATVFAWRDRKLIYNGESFKTLVQDINRYFPAEIRIGDPALDNIKVVAILKIESQAATLEALEAAFNVTARPVSRNLIYLYPNK
ncbi:MAG: DUF4880 domain-containing protein [Alphaproteobacteria bacterium]|nr:DUF4880 domain-containing protein [Alphaproteobacteria bacterium]